MKIDWRYGAKLFGGAVVLLLVLIGLLAVADDALAQDRARVWAYCEDSERGRADYALVQEAIKAGDRQSFMAVMLDPESRCKDERSTVHGSPVTVEVLERHDRFFTYSGRCMRTVTIRDAEGNLGISWLDCQGEPV